MNNPFQELLKQIADKTGCPTSKIADTIIPEVGTKFVLDNIVYKIAYKRNNPCSFTAEPVYVDVNGLNKKKLTLSNCFGLFDKKNEDVMKASKYKEAK